MHYRVRCIAMCLDVSVVQVGCSPRVVCLICVCVTQVVHVVATCRFVRVVHSAQVVRVM